MTRRLVACEAAGDPDWLPDDLTCTHRWCDRPGTMMVYPPYGPGRGRPWCGVHGPKVADAAQIGQAVGTTIPVRRVADIQRRRRARRR